MSPPANENRRRHPRASMALLVQYRFNTLEDFLSEYASNLSPGGMFIQTDQPAPIGSTVHLQFSLKDGSRLIDGLARVVRVVAADAAAEGMAVEFLDLDPDSKRILERLCGAR